jgi:ribosomal protein S18 acetylase RimI-like enzyme
MLKVNDYSTIRKEPVHKPADGYSLTAFYDQIARPPVILAIVTGYLALFQKDNILLHCDNAIKGDLKSIFHLALIFFSILAGIRLIQSIYLAKRDYQHLKSGFFDIIVFLMAIIFTSGAAVIFLHKNYLFILGVYSLFFVMGIINFYILYKIRIPKNSELYDYPIEAKIQLVNAATFLFLAIAFIFAFASMYPNQVPTFQSIIAIIVTYIPLIINIIHSEQLTLMPKFMIHNGPDKPKNQVSLFRAIYWRTSDGLEDIEIINRISKDAPDDFKQIKIVRAKLANVDIIVHSLIDEFSVLHEYLFSTKNRLLIGRVLNKVIKAAKGLGHYGYMNFYMLRSGENDVGFVMLSTSRNCIFYTIYETLTLPCNLLFLGLRQLFQIHKKVRQITSFQSEPEQGEVRITYLVIFRDYRSQGYGKSTLNLLMAALVREKTNDIECDKLTLFVRDNNDGAKRLFSRAGFKEISSADPPLPSGLSKIIKMEYSLPDKS